MFKFFKEKIKGAVSSFSKKVEEEGEDVEAPVEEPVKEEPKEVLPEKKEKTEPVKKEKVPKKEPEKEKPEEEKEEKKPKEIIEKKQEKEKLEEEKEPEEPKKKEKVVEEKKEQEKVSEKIPEEPVVEQKDEELEKKGFFKKILSKKVSEKQFEDLFFDLEVTLLENNVSVEVIEKIKEDLRKKLTEGTVPRGKVAEVIQQSLKESIRSLLKAEDFSIHLEKKPLVVCMIGINGSGKTTSIAKLTHFLQQQGKSVVLAAADTFRAAAIDQLQEHATKLGVKIIKHDYGSDPAAVAFDAVKHAQANNIDVVLIDTAGRIHSNTNLMNEVKKVVRVAEPDLKIFVGESITGNDCVEQARKFDEAVSLDGIILSKADIDEKGGAALSISYVTGKPIFFLGTGQEYGDLTPFSPKTLMETLGL